MHGTYGAGRVHRATEFMELNQFSTYLRLAKKPLGLLINFNEVLLKDGITRKRILSAASVNSSDPES